MSTEELRYYIAFLLERWPKNCLARTLGAWNRASLKSKLHTSWIYPGEQVRFTRMIDRILSGELVPVRGKHWRLRADAVVASHPVPLAEPARLKYSLEEGRLGWVVPRTRVTPRLLSFQLGVKDGLNHGR
jgi:hypothetical protein